MAKNGLDDRTSGESERRETVRSSTLPAKVWEILDKPGLEIVQISDVPGIGKCALLKKGANNFELAANRNLGFNPRFSTPYRLADGRGIHTFQTIANISGSMPTIEFQTGGKILIKENSYYRASFLRDDGYYAFNHEKYYLTHPNREFPNFSDPNMGFEQLSEFLEKMERPLEILIRK